MRSTGIIAVECGRAPSAKPAILVVTPERVQPCLDLAGLGTRALAYLVDFLILILFFWATLAFAASLLRSEGAGGCAKGAEPRRRSDEEGAARWRPAAPAAIPSGGWVVPGRGRTPRDTKGDP